MARKEGREMKKLEPEGRWLSPFEEMECRFEDMENWMEDLFGQPFWKPMRRRVWPRLPRIGGTAPSVDVFEAKNDLVIKAEVPGIRQGDLDIKVTENMITIIGEKKVEGKDYYFHKRSTGSFTRQILLPEGTESNKTKATYKDGVLEIRIPKSEELKEKTKRIPIQ